MVHTETIASTTYLGGIAGARETAVGSRRFCAAIEDEITAETLLIPFETSVVVVLTVTEGDATFHGHVCGAGVTGPRESSTLNIIPTDERSAQNPPVGGEIVQIASDARPVTRKGA